MSLRPRDIRRSPRPRGLRERQLLLRGWCRWPSRTCPARTSRSGVPAPLARDRGQGSKGRSGTRQPKSGRSPGRASQLPKRPHRPPPAARRGQRSRPLRRGALEFVDLGFVHGADERLGQHASALPDGSAFVPGGRDGNSGFAVRSGREEKPHYDRDGVRARTAVAVPMSHGSRRQG